MKVIRPVTVTDAMLVSSSVPEADHSAWSSIATYGVGARVIKTSTHRIYESATAGNIGHDPEMSGEWIEIGPTNRWAMFDQALGTATTATGSITINLAPVWLDSLALIDVIATSVRVRVVISGSTVFDQTKAVTIGDALTFFDLPPDETAQLFVTITGTGPIAAGVVLLGTVLDLGVTETNPNIGINDFSTRTTSAFGVTKILERGWAKTMTLRSQIATDDVDMIQKSVAKLRAKPALWLGEEGYDALTIYGYFKNFTADLALGSISFCSFTIEGLAE